MKEPRTKMNLIWDVGIMCLGDVSYYFVVSNLLSNEIVVPTSLWHLFDTNHDTADYVMDFIIVWC